MKNKSKIDISEEELGEISDKIINYLLQLPKDKAEIAAETFVDFIEKLTKFSREVGYEQAFEFTWEMEEAGNIRTGLYEYVSTEE